MLKKQKGQWAKELTPQTPPLQAKFILLEAAPGTTNAGAPFAKLKLGDKTGSFEAKAWQTTVDVFRLGTVYDCDLSFKEYNGKLDASLKSWADSVDHDMGEFVPTSKYDTQPMVDKLQFYMDTFDSEDFKTVAYGLMDPDSLDKFCLAPAATGMHHAFLRGLLEHTTQMLDCADVLLKQPFMAEALDRDLCMFGIMFHDFGKIYEYSTNPGFAKLEQGFLVPHIPMVAARIYEIANRSGVPERTRDYMMHVVLAHHRRLEWGSPVVFACPEAAFVHHVDNLHGDIFGMIQRRDSMKPGELVMKHGYGDGAYMVLKEPFSQRTVNEEILDGIPF